MGNTRPNMLVLSIPTNLWEYDWKGVPRRYDIMKITSLQKELIHSASTICHKFFPMPEALKILDAKAAVEKLWKNSRKYRHDSWRKSERKMRWSLKQGMRAEQCILRHWWISVILRMRSWNHNFRNTKVELYSEVTWWKMIQDHTQCLLNTDHQHHKWQPQKSWTYFKTTRMRRTSSRCIIRFSPGQNGRCTDVMKIPKSECPVFWIRLPETQMAKIMVQYGRPSCFSWQKSVRSSFGRTIVGKAIRESSVKIRLEKSSEFSSSSEKKDHSYQCMWTT